MDDDPLIPIQRAFASIGASNAVGYRLINSKQLGPVYKLGRRTLIRLSDVERFKEQLPLFKSNAEDDNQKGE